MSPHRRSMPLTMSPQPMPEPKPASTVATDPQCEQLWQTLLGENEQLRLQVAMLQGKLVEKMRSHAKVLVGGGEFRGVAGALGKRPPSSPTAVSTPTVGTQGCASCSTLRATLRQHTDAQHAAIEAMQQQTQTQLLKAQDSWESALRQREEDLDRCLQEERQRAVATAAHHELIVERMREELASATNRIEQLQEEQGRMESVPPTHQLLVPAPSDVLGPPPSSVLHSVGTKCDDGSHRQLVLPASTLIDAQRRLQETCTAHQDLRAAHETLMFDRQRFQRQLKVIEEQRDKHQREWSQRLSDAHEAASSGSATLKQQMDKQIDALRRQLGIKEDELEKLHRESQVAQEQEEIQRQALAADLVAVRSQLQQVQIEAVVLKRQVEELESQVRTSQQRVATLQHELESTTKANDQLTLTIAANAEDVARQLEHCRRSEQDADELRRSLDASLVQIQVLRSLVDDRQRMIEAAEAHTAAQDQLQRRMHTAHVSALERALQSSVRLCVVAPTVNVHLSPITSSTSVVTCKSPLPQKQLRDVVERDVLPLFATVFVQQHERVGPQGSAMDVWLQTLLNDMQESLASHLHKLYASTTASS